MGSRQSTANQRVRHMLPSPFHYHPISSSNSPTQPLLQDYNQHSMFQNLEAKAQEEKTAALERENGVLRSVVSILESKLLSKERDTNQVKYRNTNLESEVNELKAHVAELYSQLKHGKDEKTKLKEAIKKVKKRYAALEDKLEKLSTNIAEMKTASSHHSLYRLSCRMPPCLNLRRQVRRWMLRFQIRRMILLPALLF
ncbi:hypothetical protein I3843_09G108600 [Carya illinoinensis]|nr:hypothetical protein I3843_09G108600 [Carya illinoinensis]